MTTEGSVRRQPLLGIPGWLLFVCLFLPTVRVCSDPMIPAQFPPSYAIYLGGLVIGVLATATLLRTRRRAFNVLVTLWSVTVLAIVAVWVGAEVFAAGVVVGLVFLVVQVKMIQSILRAAWSERTIAIGCFVHALFATCWSGLFAFTPDGMWGAWTAFAAGLVMMIASALMIASAHEEVLRKRRETEPAALPEARAIVRD
jgi:hypothetical protein